MKPDVVVFRHNQGKPFVKENIRSVMPRCAGVLDDDEELFRQELLGVVNGRTMTVYVLENTVLIAIWDESAPTDGGWEATRMAPATRVGPWSTTMLANPDKTRL